MSIYSLCLILAVAFAIRVVGEWLVCEHYFKEHKKLCNKEANNDRD